MTSDFSRTLALLRKEKKISQRTAAIDLDVSHALLSHYENGLREPGLGFVIRAADYYGVSCDYLLGRSMARDGSSSSSKIKEISAVSLTPSELTEAHRKIINNAVTLLFDISEQTSSKQLSDEIAQYLSLVIYKVFRYLYLADPDRVEAAFRTNSNQFDGLCNAQMALSELRIRSAALGSGEFGLEIEDIRMPSLTPTDLTRNFPNISQSMLTLLQSVADIIEPHQNIRRGDKRTR